MTGRQRPRPTGPAGSGHPALKSFLLVAAVTILLIVLAAVSTFG